MGFYHLWKEIGLCSASVALCVACSGQSGESGSAAAPSQSLPVAQASPVAPSSSQAQPEESRPKPGIRDTEAQLQDNGFYFSSSSATRGPVSSIGGNSIEGGARKRLSVALSACLKLNSGDQALGKGREFEIGAEGDAEADSRKDSSPLRRVTQGDGCLYWEDQLDFGIYESERWIKKTYLIRSLDPNESQASGKISFYLNPRRHDRPPR